MIFLIIFSFKRR